MDKLYQELLDQIKSLAHDMDKFSRFGYVITGRRVGVELVKIEENAKKLRDLIHTRMREQKNRYRLQNNRPAPQGYGWGLKSGSRDLVGEHDQ